MSRTIGCAISVLIFQTAVLAAQSDRVDDDDDPQLSPEAAAAAPLFASHDLLEFTIEAPFKEIFKERGQESEYHPAVLRYEDETGAPVSIDFKVKTRGKFRLKKSTCNFPPIRLNFPKKAVGNTIFAEQDGMKLVTHCQNKRDEYEQYVLMEYLVYRTYNLLTDLSLRVRLAKITYIDTEENDDPITKHAFLIEHDDMLAARSRWEHLEVPYGIPQDFMDPEQISVVDVFNYMIGNTDFSAFMPPPDDDECCHNVKLYGTMAGPVLPVPYDFDFSGIVDARYAKPAESLRLRNVRQRLFRGLCQAGRETVDRAVAIFQEKKDDIYALYQEQEGLDEKRREKAIEYLDDFYKVVDDPKKVTREFVEDCRTR